MGLWEKSTALLLAERDCASLFVHAFNDSERFQMDAFFAQLIAAGLESFFNYDARTDQGCTGGFYQGSKTRELFRLLRNHRSAGLCRWEKGILLIR